MAGKYLLILGVLVVLVIVGVGCEQKAITFELVRPPEHIPAEQASQFSLAGIPGFTYIREENLK